MLQFRIRQIVVGIDIIAMGDNMWEMDNWLPHSDLIEVIEFLHQKHENAKNNHWEEAVNISFVIEESDLIPGNGFGHILEVH